MAVLTNMVGNGRSSPTSVVELVLLRVVSPHLLQYFYPLSSSLLELSSQGFQDIGFLAAGPWDTKLSKLDPIAFALTHLRALKRKRD